MSLQKSDRGARSPSTSQKPASTCWPAYCRSACNGCSATGPPSLRPEPQKNQKSLPGWQFFSSRASGSRKTLNNSAPPTLFTHGQPLCTTDLPLASALRTVLLGISLATASQGAFAATSGDHTYRIAPGSLDSVLGSFGQQSGVMIAVDSALTTGIQSKGLNGNFEVTEGLEHLLAPLGLQAVSEGDGYRVTAKPHSNNGPLELQSTQVNANQLGTITEGTGSYTPGTIATATRRVLSPRETPQSITVITRQHMDDFGLNSIDDVMRHTPGITVSTFDSERNNYYARGFSVENFQYDGIPTLRNSAYSSGQTLSDMAIYDRVEVLKGATGLLTGAGAPGATINLVRKKPTRDFKASVELGAGSWDNYRSQADISGPLTDSGNVRGRGVVAYQDKRSFMERYERKTGVYFGTLEADLTEDTLLSPTPTGPARTTAIRRSLMAR